MGKEGVWGMLRGMYMKMTSSERGELIMGLVVSPTAVGGQQEVTDITKPNVFSRLERIREG